MSASSAPVQSSDKLLKKISVFKEPVIDPDSVTAAGGAWTVVASIALIVYAAFLVLGTINQEIVVTTQISPVSGTMAPPIRLECTHPSGCLVQVANGNNIDDQSNFITMSQNEKRDLTPKIAFGGLWIGFYARTCGGGCGMITAGEFAFTSIGATWDANSQHTTTQVPGRLLNPDDSVIDAPTTGDLMQTTTVLLLTKTVDKVGNGPEKFSYVTAGISLNTITLATLLDKWFLYQAAPATGQFLFNKVGCDTIKTGQCPNAVTRINSVSANGPQYILQNFYVVQTLSKSKSFLDIPGK
ncbi:hypothetical protein HDU93_000023 [Gonapodya sp. JEL0774]|nr:hypothetical protein HDU93_000023 [Gonapodya sp. JEL0774]